MDKKVWKTAEKNVLTSFWVHAAPKSWSNYTTGILLPDKSGFQMVETCLIVLVWFWNVRTPFCHLKTRYRGPVFEIMLKSWTENAKLSKNWTSFLFSNGKSIWIANNKKSGFQMFLVFRCPGSRWQLCTYFDLGSTCGIIFAKHPFDQNFESPGVHNIIPKRQR